MSMLYIKSWFTSLLHPYNLIMCIFRLINKNYIYILLDFMHSFFLIGRRYLYTNIQLFQGRKNILISREMSCVSKEIIF